METPSIQDRLAESLPDFTSEEIATLAEHARVGEAGHVVVPTLHGWLPAVPVWARQALDIMLRQQPPSETTHEDLVALIDRRRYSR